MKSLYLLAFVLLLPLESAWCQRNLLAEEVHRANVSTIETDVPIISGKAIGGVSVDAAGRIYTSNFRRKVYRIELDGTVTTFSKAFERASGNTIDDRGELLQSEYGLNRLYRVHENGTRTLITETGLDGPVGVVMQAGDIYVVNYLGDTISRITPDGTTWEFSADPLLNGPNGIVFDALGDMYVVNLKDNLVLRVDEGGRAHIVAALGQNIAFNNAHVVSIGNSLYVSKIFEHKIYKLALTGEVELVIGTGAPGVLDGLSPGNARLYHPNGMALAPDGRTLFTNNYIGAMGTPGAPMKIRAIEVW